MNEVNMIYLTPAPILQQNNNAKREWRIATSLVGRSASPMTGGTYSVHALRKQSQGQNWCGVQELLSS